MASPFTVFRKHQKVLIATLGLMAMVAFVILPQILQQMGVGGPSADPVVVVSKYGDLKESQLERMRHRRQRLISFLERAVDLAGFDRAQTVSRKMAIEQYFGNAGEESTVDLWLMVERAKELGMTISDSAVSEFIRSKYITDDRVTNEQFAQLYKNLKVSEDEIFDALQEELLAQQLQESFVTSLAGTPPGLRWEYYQRLNRKVNIQSAAIKVDDYLDKVEDPGDEELKKYFEEHKDDLAMPNSPKPGFRVPAMVSVEYVKVDFEKYADVKPVTDGEIEDYYLKNRDKRFVKPDLPGLDEGEKPAESKEAKAAEEKQPEAKAVEEKPAEKQAEKPAAEKPAAAETVKPAAPEEKPAASKEEPKAEKPAGAEPKTSAASSQNVFRLVSMAEEKKAESDKAADKPEVKAEAAKPAEEKKSEAKPADAKPAEEKQSEPKPAEAKSAEKAEPKPTEKGAEKPAEDGKYQPLAQVREEIRQILAKEKLAKAEKAFKELETTLQPIRSAVSKYRSDWNLYKATVNDQGAPEPAKPDFDALAKQQNLTFHQTGPVSAVELSDLDIGRSMVEGQQSLLSYIFDGSALYRPSLCSDMGGNVYLFWKTDSSDERVPKFDDKGMRDKVLASWKTGKARDIALKEAEKLAAEARESKKTLAEAIGSRINVFESGPFSWITPAPVGPQGQVRMMLSSVEHVDRPGEDFMRAVYDLQVGQVGAAMNEPQTAVYVVQLAKTDPGDKVLWEGFKADPYGNYASVAQSDQMQILKSWYEDIRSKAKMKWERKPVPAAKYN